MSKNLTIIDDYFPPELVRAAANQWPADDWGYWHRYENGKMASKDPLRHPPACAELTRQLLCLPIGTLTGIHGAFGDWDCHGAGLHSMSPGSSLGIHQDSDRHPFRPWRRAVNAMLYLSEWRLGCGGEFILHNESDGDTVIHPQFNRLVLFIPQDIRHSVREVKYPFVRKSVTVFFWTYGEGGSRSCAKFE